MALKMSDIAEMAGVSKTAVSLALNGRDGISKETREKIMAVVKEAGYTRQRKRRTPSKRLLGAVTFLVVTTPAVVRDNYRALPFFSSLISSLSANVAEFGGTLNTVTIDATHLREGLQQLDSEDQLGGTMVLATDLKADQVQLIQQQMRHVVFLDTYYEDITADFVTMDNYQGGGIAAQHILDKGYTDIGYFASDKMISNFSGRRQGFRNTLAKQGLRVSNDHFYFISPTESDPKGLDMKRLGASLPEAIFCEDDYIAIRLLKAARAAGMRVPEDLAIMGFDDIYEDTLVTPELTTIHVPVEQMANQATYQLQKQISATQWNPQKVLVSTRLVKRNSL
ncbi:LacI family DNA-binding transcriptional regulator [Schleiferilactobacillus harbinensis]|uniref:Ribose operon repressor n=1 Tax=Schleiferilactobacillus harbinensis DSM 16991 TaxID=1122147 RepID=A0A0R1XGV6_9LACO|nr:LacI family DNA-binding transcriptional regulator [Schleiferilactobacillus harbinensis]KRM27668.1 ribose operon repressor [Schleiferilactobacillus harbinensis DSM 16991]